VRKKAGIIKYENIGETKNSFKGKKIVLVGGCFDLIHYGHLKFLEKAKEQGNFLIIALEPDEFIKEHKRKLPVHSQLERAEILANLNMVDLVIILPLFKNYYDYFNLVKIISPNIIAVTSGDKQLENKRKQAREVGAEVKEVVSDLKNFSTRKIAKVFNL
jgi:FAD synthetase